MQYQASTLVPSPNASYLSQTSRVLPISDPLSGSTMGLMMMLSALQYQAPYMNPTYSGAATQAGKAAFIESGGQAFQDKSIKYVQVFGKKIATSVGITGSELGFALGAAKVIRDKQLDLNGPKIYIIETHLTLGQSNGNVNLKWNW